MTNQYKPQNHKRRSVRLKGYDYSRTGAYFVTICSERRACVFGEIVRGEMCPNDAGLMVGQWWLGLKGKFPNIDVEHYVIMPNHLHGIVRINPVEANLCVRPDVGIGGKSVDGLGDGPSVRAESVRGKMGAHAGAPLPTLIQWFKTMTTNHYIRGVIQLGWRAFSGRLWQRNYFEHIIRDESSLSRIQTYIATNPECWATDVENPLFVESG